MSEATFISPSNALTQPFCDTISLRNLSFTLPKGLGQDAWGRLGKPQPVISSIKISFNSVAKAAANDDVASTIDYGKLYKGIVAKVSDENVVLDGPTDLLICMRDAVFASLAKQDFAEVGQGEARSWSKGFAKVWIQVRVPQAVLLAETGIVFEQEWSASIPWDAEHETWTGSYAVENASMATIRVEGVRCACVVGVNPHERIALQNVIVGFERQYTVRKLPTPTNCDTLTATLVEVRNLLKTLFHSYEYETDCMLFFKAVKQTSYKTLESLATYIAHTIYKTDLTDPLKDANSELKVCVEKPSALTFVDGSGVEIIRRRAFFEGNHDLLPPAPQKVEVDVHALLKKESAM